MRAGADKGRIYRVYPQGVTLRPIRNLTKLATPELVAALDTRNGTTRDLVHLELLRRGDQAAIGPLGELARSSSFPAVRVQTWCALDGLRAVTPGLLQHALTEAHPAVRRHALRISEPLLASSPALAAACLQLATDSDPGVRYQLALTLGEWDDARGAEALARIAASALDYSWIQAAVLSSAARHPWSCSTRF